MVEEGELAGADCLGAYFALEGSPDGACAEFETEGFGAKVGETGRIFGEGTAVRVGCTTPLGRLALSFSA